MRGRLSFAAAMAMQAGMMVTTTAGRTRPARTSAVPRLSAFERESLRRAASGNGERERARRVEQMARGMLRYDSRGLEYEGLGNKHLDAKLRAKWRAQAQITTAPASRDSSWTWDGAQEHDGPGGTVTRDGGALCAAIAHLRLYDLTRDGGRGEGGDERAAT